MQGFLIQEYVGRMNVSDIDNFAKKQGITLSEEELKIIYEYIKNHWRTFYYGNPKELLEELKGKLSINVYNKLEALYIQAKNKISNP
jgi:sulfur relay (sulfurtransferase) DsrC/TusE family protein